MIKLPRQLTLDWPHQPSFAREDFLAAPSNREALRAIEQWPDWAGRMLLLVGPEGAGKSHLASLWAETAGAVVVRGEALEGAGVEIGAQSSALLIEDADRIGHAEDLLFPYCQCYAAAWRLAVADGENRARSVDPEDPGSAVAPASCAGRAARNA